jgi:hypothetical protein
LLPHATAVSKDRNIQWNELMSVDAQGHSRQHPGHPRWNKRRDVRYIYAPPSVLYLLRFLVRTKVQSLWKVRCVFAICPEFFYAPTALSVDQSPHFAR